MKYQLNAKLSFKPFGGALFQYYKPTRTPHNRSNTLSDGNNDQ